MMFCLAARPVLQKRRIFQRVGLVLAACLALGCGACSTASYGTAGVVKKVKYFELTPDNFSGVKTRGVDRMITNEPKHLMWGAVTNAQLTERFGNYYTAWWKVDDRSRPVTVRLSYRQAKEMTAVKTMEQVVNKPSGYSNLTKFQVTGPVYFQYGKVAAWRLSLHQGGAEVAASQSYLWE